MTDEIETKIVYVAYSNTDCTEGRGHDFPIAFCEQEATARRIAKKAYVQGSDGPVKPLTLFKHHGRWYGPVEVQQPTGTDIALQKVMDAKEAARARAKALGLTDEEILALVKPS